MFTLNGATAGNNVDVGIYTGDGTRLISMGSTAQSGTNAIQTYNITDTALGAGLYRLGIAMDGTTGTLFRQNSNALFENPAGIQQQASAFALPATLTGAAAASSYQPVFGLTRQAVV